MINFFPNAYPDELLYSRLSRYYAKSGYLAYICAAEDLYQQKTIRPNMEFINALTPETVAMVTKNMPMDLVIQRHTMFPYYGRFLLVGRRQKAFQSLLTMSNNYHNLLPLPKRKSSADRYLRYCPLCAEQDRELYGETYWHRVHQMIGVDVCSFHRCYLRDSKVIISGNAPPMLKTAEESVPKGELAVFVNNDLEYRVAEYMTEVFLADMDLDSPVAIGQFLHHKMMVGQYSSSKGGHRNIGQFHTDFLEYYRLLEGNWFYELWQIQKVLTDERINFYEICLMALFLGVSVDELAHRILPEKAQQCGKKRRPSENPLKSGAKPHDWEKVDDETLPLVRVAIKKLWGNDHDRPRRVTVTAVEKMLGLPSKRISTYLPKCRAEVMKYQESQEQYWAREVVWAVKQLQLRGEPLQWGRVSYLTNMRKTNLEACLPYIARYADSKLELSDGQLVRSALAFLSAVCEKSEGRQRKNAE